MYLLFITLIFSLALGPDVKLLSAQMAEEELMSVPNNQSTIFSQVTQSSSGEETTAMNPDPTTARLITMTENVEQTSGKIMTKLVPALQTSPEPAAIPVSINNITTNDMSTPAPPPESTSQPQQKEEMKIMTNIITTEPPQTPSPPPSIPDPPASTAEPPVLTSTPAIDKEETTDTSPTITPTAMPTTTPTATPTTTPTTMPTTIMSTTITISTTTTVTTNTTPQEQTTPSTLITSTNSIDTGGIGAGSKDGKGPQPNWLIVAIIALVIFCILTTICVMVVICRRRKQSGKQHFGPMNGQKRSKKKKGAEDDVWAGPVKLGGGDSEDSEEGDVQGEEKGDGVEATGLSTFAMMEENGGVGRPGSPEVTKWEEKEPLLFIDEEGKEKRNEAGKSEDADANGEAGKSDAKEAEPNGGETFCLTTAV